MPFWTPAPIWKDESVIIVGGGRSLLDFDWSVIKKYKVLVCNRAYLKMPDGIADAVIMCDKSALNASYEDLQTFPGIVFLNLPEQKKWTEVNCPSWAYSIERFLGTGLCDNGLCWNGHTGAAAINLALLCGAKRLYLLGFDMKAEDQKNPDWYRQDHEWDKNNPAVDARFDNWLGTFPAVERDRESMFPAAQIINVNDNSALDTFQKISVEAFTEISKAEHPENESVDSGSGGITVITPTGDRPLAFALCKQWMKNQTRQPDQWIVVDDGRKLLTPSNGMMYIRREPCQDDPPHTLVSNLIVALPKITGDKILIMEDDEYYAPGYIEEMSVRLDKSEIVGICQSKYYHVPTGGYRIFASKSHASLAQTAFRASFLSEIKTILSESKNFSVDMKIWKSVACRSGLFVDDVIPLYLGIKGLPGRSGIGIGHKPTTYGNVKDTNDKDVLKKWVPEDYQVYLDIMGGKLTNENYGSYFQEVDLLCTR